MKRFKWMAVSAAAFVAVSASAGTVTWTADDLEQTVAKNTSSLADLLTFTVAAGEVGALTGSFSSMAASAKIPALVLTSVSLSSGASSSSVSGFSFSGLTAGTYSLSIAYDFAPKGGLLTGSATLTTAAVPEPSSVALVLAGLGVVTGVARRRRLG